MEKKSSVQTVIFLGLFVSLGLVGCKSTETAQKRSDAMVDVQAQLSIIETKLDAIMERQEMVILEEPSLQTRADTPAKKSTRRLTYKEIQKALKMAGYDPGVIDGRFGKKTRSALKKFQRSHGLTADGIAGKQTMHYLNDYL